MTSSQYSKPLIALLLLCGAACAPTQNEAPVEVTADGPDLSEAELALAIKAAKAGDETAYQNSMAMLLGSNKFEAAEKLASNYTVYDKGVSANHLCELRDVYNLELKARSEAIIQEQGGTC